jgi:NADH-quinone oxidoreductase subunit A
MFLFHYLSAFMFLVFSFVLSSIIFLLSFALSSKMGDAEKLAAYECGFNPFDDSRGEFDIRFFIVAILFLIFDLEISFLFPFVTCLDFIEMTPFISMFVFLFVLTVGFFYE